MAHAIYHDIVHELGLNDFDDGKEGNSSDEEEMPPSIEQEFSYDVRREKLTPVQVTSILSPNRLVVKFLDNDAKNNSNCVNSNMKSKIYNEYKRKQYALDAGEDLDEKQNPTSKEHCSKNKYVIVSKATWDKFGAAEFVDDADDSSDEDNFNFDENKFTKDMSDHFTGIILSYSPKDMKYQVFVSDLGLVTQCTEYDICPIPPGNEFLLENPLHAIVTIPGIVPRKRMDNVPGLADINFQDRDWNKGAREDVQNWLSSYKIILLRKLIQESPSIFYGDFYGTNRSDTKTVSKDDLLSAYLTRQKNVFFNYQLLNRIHETKD